MQFASTAATSSAAQRGMLAPRGRERRFGLRSQVAHADRKAALEHPQRHRCTHVADADQPDLRAAYRNTAGASAPGRSSSRATDGVPAAGTSGR